jgi:hypothetical protein
MTWDSETALYTMTTETGNYSRYELDLRKDFIALANTPAAIRPLPKIIILSSIPMEAGS